MEYIFLVAPALRGARSMENSTEQRETGAYRAAQFSRSGKSAQNRMLRTFAGADVERLVYFCG